MRHVFLVGSPRSGTTLLQRLLSEDERLTTFPESSFFWHAFGSSAPRRRLGLVRRRAALEGLTAFARACGARDFSVPDEVRASPFVRPWFRVLAGLMDRVAGDRGARGWIEKTPIHLHYLSVIERLDPEARFVHVVRNGVDVVASVTRVSREHPEAWGGARTVSESVDRWLLDVKLHARRIGRPRHRFVLFEEVLGAPGATVDGVLRFLGYQGPVARAQSIPPEWIVTPGEPWKAGATRPVSPTETTGPEAALTPAELSYVRERTGPVDLSIFRGGRAP